MSKKCQTYATLAAVAMVAVAALFSVYAAGDRNKREASYRTVEICLDYDDFSGLAVQWPEGAESYWHALKSKGATSVAVSELSVGWLEDAGYLVIAQLPPDGPNARHLMKPQNTETAKVLAKRLAERLFGMVRPVADGYEVTGVSYETLRSINIGPNDFAIKQVKLAGLGVVLRLSSFAGFDGGWIEAISDIIEDDMPVIFTEKQVGGFPNRLEDAALALEAEGAVVGQVEFAGQLGMDVLADLMVPNVVRVHSITPEELAKGMPEEVAVERFARAVRERSMRLMYIRPYRFSGPDTDPAGYNLGYVADISRSVRDSGFSLGRPAAPRTGFPWDLRLMLALVALGSSAAAFLVIAQLLGYKPAVWLSGLMAAGLAAAGIALPYAVGRALIPFAASVAMPCLGASAWLGIMRSNRPYGFGKTVLGWAVASVISVAGGLMLAAPVADTAHMLGVGVFSGIKLAQVLPLCFALAAFWAIAPGRKGRSDLKGLADDAARLGMEPIRWWQAAVVGLIGAIGLYMVIRSGNSSPALVSGFEAGIRKMLENVLVFRPRSKEVFIGHPALLLAGALMAYEGARPFAMAAFVLGMVAQVSMVNTFMHLHTPVAATLTRTGLGIALGLILGLLAVWALKCAVAFDRRRRQAR